MINEEAKEKKMTPEEAIKEFESELEWAELNIYPYISKQKVEADKMAIKAIEQTTWVPCSERLPEEGEEVLVSGFDTNNKKVIVARYQGEQYGFTCGLVSAWMPLPEPMRLENE